MQLWTHKEASESLNLESPIADYEWLITVDHDCTIEIYWLVYIFPWWQPESTKGVCPFDVREGILSNKSLWHLAAGDMHFLKPC